MKTGIFVYNRPDLSGTGHPYIHAYSLHPNSDYAMMGLEVVTAIRFSYMRIDKEYLASIPSGRFAVDKANVAKSDHNNLDVIYIESPLSFKEFCRRLLTSIYMDDKKYSFLYNNCVHATIYALEQAGIKLDLDKSYRWKPVFYCIPCPTTSSTPAELMVSLRKYIKEGMQPIINTPNEIGIHPSIKNMNK